MKKKFRSKLSVDKDQKLQKVNPYLETQRQHKDWYQPKTMGKQRGKPRYDMAGIKIKKQKGSKPLTKVFKKP